MQGFEPGVTGWEASMPSIVPCKDAGESLLGVYGVVVQEATSDSRWLQVDFRSNFIFATIYPLTEHK